MQFPIFCNAASSFRITVSISIRSQPSESRHILWKRSYTMLCFRPRIEQKKGITEKKLTEYLEEVILIFKRRSICRQTCKTDPPCGGQGVCEAQGTAEGGR